MVYLIIIPKRRGIRSTMYSFKSRVRFSELNHQIGALGCSSIINYFQDCSTFQSEDLNIGLDYLEANNRVWLMNSWQLQIVKPAKLADDLIVGTWAYDFKGFYGYRNFIMKDEKDQVFAVANSIWVYLDTETGRPAKIPEDHGGYDLEPPYPMEHAARKIDLPEHAVRHPSFTVIKSNIDTYHHVNNGQYIKMAEEYLPGNFLVHTMRVEYRMQAVIEDVMIPMVSEEDGRFLVVLENEGKKPYAIIEFEGEYTTI
jgi:acyl-ACP thioesterase